MKEEREELFFSLSPVRLAEQKIRSKISQLGISAETAEGSTVDSQIGFIFLGFFSAHF